MPFKAKAKSEKRSRGKYEKKTGVENGPRIDSADEEKKKRRSSSSSSSVGTRKGRESEITVEATKSEGVQGTKVSGTGTGTGTGTGILTTTTTNGKQLLRTTKDTLSSSLPPLPLQSVFRVRMRHTRYASDAKIIERRIIPSLQAGRLKANFRKEMMEKSMIKSELEKNKKIGNPKDSTSSGIGLTSNAPNKRRKKSHGQAHLLREYYAHNSRPTKFEVYKIAASLGIHI